MQGPQNGKEQLIQEKEAIIKSNMKAALKKVFVLHGAVDIELPNVTPMQDSVSIFVSNKQQLIPLDRKQSTHSEGAAT